MRKLRSRTRRGSVHPLTWRTPVGAASAVLMLVAFIPAVAIGQDADGDGLSDIDETGVYGTDPTLYDTDGDGVHDGDEVDVSGTDPLDTDSDDDGLLDGQERVGVGGFNPPEELQIFWIDHLADLDGDGDSDFVFTNGCSFYRSENALDASLPTFGPVISEQPCYRDSDWAVALIDMDADGDLDMLRAEEAGYAPPPEEGQRDDEIVLYENRLDEPSADFAPPVYPTVPIDSGWLRAVDLDADGRRDLLRITRPENSLVVPTLDVLIDRSDSGPPMFDSVIVVAQGVDPRQLEWTVAEGDVDLDGDVDLVWIDHATSPQQVLWASNRLNEGEADFAPPIGLIPSVTFGGESSVTLRVDIAELDGTPYPEILIWGDDPSSDIGIRVDILANPFEERPDWSAPLPQSVRFPDWSISYQESLALVDVDGDGDRDLIGLDCHSLHCARAHHRYPDALGWVENRLDTTQKSFGPTHRTAPRPPGYFPWQVEYEVDDLDLDGDEDVIFEQPLGAPPSFFENTWNLGTDPLSSDSDGDGLPDGEEHLTLGTDPALRDTDLDGVGDGEEIEQFGSDPLVADSDGDGLLDGEESPGPELPLGFSRTVFRPRDLSVSLRGDLSVSDLDADGDRDIVVRSDEVLLLENRLMEPEAELSRFDFGPTLGRSAWRGDLERAEPGPPTALITSTGDLIERHVYSGNPRQPWETSLTLGEGAGEANLVWARDVDRDGDDDVLFMGHYSTQIRWIENRVNEPSADYAEPVVVATIADSVQSARVGDIDGDGDDDVVYAALDAEHIDGTVEWIENRMNEATTDFAPARVIASIEADSNLIFRLALGDLDGDGDLDAIVANLPRSEVTWLENRLDVGLGFAQRFVGELPPRYVTGLATGDVNRDGRDDVAVVTNPGSSIDRLARLSVFVKSEAPGGFLRREFEFRDENVSEGDLIVSDLDGDGDDDILVNDYWSLHLIEGHGNLGTNVLDPDSDDDGLRDGEEHIELGTNPLDPDSDADGFDDGEEIVFGCDPLDSSSPDSIWRGRLALLFGCHRPGRDACGLGAELVLMVPVLLQLRRRNARRRY